MKRLFWMVSAAVAVGALLTRAGKQQRALASAGAGQAEEEAAFPADVPVGDDGAVLSMLVVLDEHQIAAAEMALNRPVRDEVQSLATMLRDEHQSDLDKNRALLDELGVEPPQDGAFADVEGSFLKRRRQLSKVDDEQFQSNYIEDLIDEHERFLALIDRSLLPAASDQRVAKRVRNARKHLTAHLAEARLLN